MNSDQSLEIPGKRMRPFDIKDFVLRRSVLIIATGLAIFLLLSPAAFILRKNYYQTGGTILLSSEVNLLAPRDVRRVPGLFREFAMTHANRIKGESVIRKALTDLPKEEWPSFLPRDIPVSVAATILSRKIVVNLVGESQLLYVGLVGDEPGGLDRIINNIMATYIHQLEEEQEHDSKRRLVYLSDEKASVTSEINNLKVTRAKLAVELKSNSFNELRNPVYDRLIASQVNFLNASARAMEQKSFLEKAEREQTVRGAEDLTVFAREMVETNEAVYMIDNWTYQRLQDLRAGIDGLTADNLDRIHVEERMKAMTEYLAKFKSDMHATMLGILKEKRDFELNAERTKAEGSFIAANEYAEKLAAEMESTFSAFTASSESIVDGMELSEEISNLKDRLGFFDQRISEVILDAKAPIFLSLEEPAHPPLEPSGDKFYKILAMLFVGSMGMVGVSTLAFELLDGRVKSPGDVKSALGGVPLVPVPTFEGHSKSLAFSDCVKSQPLGPCAKAIRSSVVRLNLQRDLNGAKIFLFCGASPQSGVSSLVENFADGFSQYVDQVLILSFGDEAGIERPSGVKDPASDSIVEATLNQFPKNEPWIAKIDLNGDSKLMRKRSLLPEFLSESKARFGVILIDARPLANSDLTQFLAARSDTVVLVARRGYTQYSALRQDVEFLFRIGVPGLSAVFNAAVKQPMDHLIEFKTKAVEFYVPAAKAELAKRICKFLSRFGLAGGTIEIVAHGNPIQDASIEVGPAPDQRGAKESPVESRQADSIDDVILPG